MGSNPTLRADSMTVSTRGLALTGHLRIRSGLLADPVLRCLFAIGFLLTSVYVATFNYTTFRLKAAPYSFGQAALSAIFLVTIFGITASTLAGVAVDRVGRFRPLLLGLALMMTGIAMTLETGIVQIIAGVATINAGFFIAHSVVSGWVERESKSAKGHAASQYLLFYYLGSSISGVAGGWFWRLWGWPGVGGMMTAATVLAVLLTGPPLAANLESDVDSDLSAIETTTLRAWPPFGAFDAPALLGRTARSRTPLHVDARAPLRAVAPLNLLPEYASGEDRGGLRPVSGRHQVLAGVGSGRFFRCTLSRRNVPQAAPQQ